MANMTPEERERFMERMRARGFTPPTDGQAASSTPAPQRGRGQGPGSSKQASTAAKSPAAQGPTTFDALFGPLAPTVTFGQVWLNVDGKLQRARLRLGITDGQQTELLQTLEGAVDEGTELVTNVTTGAVRQAPQGGNAFPGLGGGRQGFPGGGFPGGGGGRGGRGGD